MSAFDKLRGVLRIITSTFVWIHMRYLRPRLVKEIPKADSAPARQFDFGLSWVLKEDLYASRSDDVCFRTFERCRIRDGL